MNSLEVLAAISFLATLVVGFSVGGRLLMLARVTRRAAESFLGLSVATLTLAGALEVLGLELARAGDTEMAYPVEIVALFLHSVAASSLCFSIWRVFHPDRRSAFYLCVITSALLFNSWMATILPGRHTSVTGFTNWFYLNVAMRAFASLWGAVEAFAHHRQLRRRLALGLADRFICHRFLLWSLGLACSAAIFLTALLTNVLLGVLVFAWSPGLLGVSVLGVTAGWGLWFAFLPPRFYRRWIDGGERLAASDGLA
jgi:hypothetical protein